MAKRIPEDVELVARTQYAADNEHDGLVWDEALDSEREIYRRDAAAVLAALAEAGRLRDPEATVVDEWTEWASEHSNHNVPGLPDPFYQSTGREQLLAEVRVRSWTESHPHGTQRLVSRQCIEVAGPWLPVPPDTDKTSNEETSK